MGKRITKRAAATVPEPMRVELFWVDERVRTPRAKKILPGKQRPAVEVNCPRGTLRDPGVAVFESRDYDKVLTWIRERKQEGWVPAAEVEERRELMAILVGAAKRGRASDGTYFAHMVHKPSGRGEKGSRKPQRDRQMPKSVRNNGTVVGTRVKGAWGA